LLDGRLLAGISVSRERGPNFGFQWKKVF